MRMQEFNEVRPVIIVDDVCIGGRVTILPEVHVDQGVIIRLGSVVTKDIPEYAIVTGNSAIVKKYRKEL